MLSKLHRHSAEECKDAGLALVLICLICYLSLNLPFFILAAIILLLMAMTHPPLFQPFAIFWFALSKTLGEIASKIILSGLFFTLVLPIGLARRALGKDTMQLKLWKNGEESVFRTRNHSFEAKDLDLPY
ncbi:hypothetical protein [Geopsychrobacter electrodiphilus]|uniref:hypothetical protein n=1 Tax=Geopsychrobacter electrodiphilus TaxID=225196 RepID=UPI0003669C3E|nr:hypothetical protein [Geopsychrobacter electrodiphilus]